MVKKKLSGDDKLIILGIGVFILAVLFVAKIALTGGPVENPGLDSFAQCLTDSGLVMYGTEWCSYCKKQKELFGDSFRFVDYVDCDKDGESCTREGIKGFPTWKISGESYPGVKSFDVLGSLSGCELK